MKGYLDWRMQGKMNCERIIASVELSAGNETVGDRWIETRSFSVESTIQEIMDWAGYVGISGKLYITPDLATEAGKK